MFDIGWSELLIVAVVAIIVVGPKDLPAMLRSIGKIVGQLRRLAGEFTQQFEEAIRDSELSDVQNSIRDITSMDPMRDLENSIDKSIADERNAASGETGDGAADDEGDDSDNDDFGDDDDMGSDGDIIEDDEFAHIEGEPASVASGRSDPDTAAADRAGSEGVQAGNGAGDHRKLSVAERAEQSWKSTLSDEGGA